MHPAREDTSESDYFFGWPFRGFFFSYSIFPVYFHSLTFFFIHLSRHLHMKDSSCPGKVERSEFSLRSNPYLKKKRKCFFHQEWNFSTMSITDLLRFWKTYFKISKFMALWISAVPPTNCKRILHVLPLRIFFILLNWQFLHFFTPLLNSECDSRYCLFSHSRCVFNSFQQLSKGLVRGLNSLIGAKISLKCIRIISVDYFLLASRKKTMDSS